MFQVNHQDPAVRYSASMHVILQHTGCIQWCVTSIGVGCSTQYVAAAVERMTVSGQYFIGPLCHVDVLLHGMR